MDVKLIEELDNMIPRNPERPEDFGVTAKEYASEKHTTVKQAYAFLESAVENGFLEKTKMKLGSWVTNVYHRPTSENSRNKTGA